MKTNLHDAELHGLLAGPNNEEVPAEVFAAVGELEQRLGPRSHLVVTWGKLDAGGVTVDVLGLTAAHIFGVHYAGVAGWEFTRLAEGQSDVSSWSRSRSQVKEIRVVGLRGGREELGSESYLVIVPRWEIDLGDRVLNLDEPTPRGYVTTPSRQEQFVVELSRDVSELRGMPDQ